MENELGNKIRSVVLVFVFVVIITVQLWTTIFQIEDLPGTEWRVLTTKPNLSIDTSLFEYSATYESYYIDHFSFRYLTLRISHAVRYYVFQERFFSTVIIGEEGYLHVFDRALTDTCQKIPQWGEARMSVLVERLSAAQEFFDDRGIDFAIGIIPDKCTVYPETIDALLPVLGHQSGADQILVSLSEDTSIRVIDLSESLIENKDQNVYLRTDTHWAPMGAYFAYQQISNTLYPDLVAGDMYSWDYSTDYVLETRENTDLGKRTNLSAYASEEIRVPSEDLQNFSVDDNGLIFHYSNPDAALGQTVVIFGDSNIHTFVPFIAQDFQDVIVYLTNRGFHWTSDPTALSEMVEEWHPDVVMVLYVERNVYRLFYNGPIYTL